MSLYKDGLHFLQIIIDITFRRKLYLRKSVSLLNIKHKTTGVIIGFTKWVALLSQDFGFFSKMSFVNNKSARLTDVGFRSVVMYSVGLAQFLKAKIHYEWVCITLISNICKLGQRFFKLCKTSRRQMFWI